MRSARRRRTGRAATVAGSTGANTMSRGRYGRGRRSGPSLCTFHRRRLIRDAPEAALAAREVLKRPRESCRIEVRPQAVDEVQLGVGAFPQQKIAQALLAAGADQQVDIRCAAGLEWSTCASEAAELGRFAESASLGAGRPRSVLWRRSSRPPCAGAVASSPRSEPRCARSGAAARRSVGRAGR